MKKLLKAEDRSKNEFQNETNDGMDNAELTLMEKIKQTVGEPKHSYQSHFSLSKLAEYFKCEEDPSNYIRWKDEDERQELYYLFHNVSERLQFNSYLHRKVVFHLKGRFTANQLECIFQAYNGGLVDYYESVELSIMSNLFDHIENEGENYDLEDIEALKSEIKSINSFEFEVFVNMIIEAWKTDGIKEMFSLFQKD